MRLSVVVAAVSLSIIGLAVADDVRASIIKRPTNIPAQGLGTALQTLAKDRNFQVVYVSEEVNSLRTKGAVGEFTSEEALKQLLSGTGMTFRYLDDKTVTIVRVSSSSTTSEGSAPVSPSTAPPASPPIDSQKEEDKSLWNRFRVAQVAQGSSQSSPPVKQANEQASNVKPLALEEVLVTAQKREERLQNVPISISVLNGNDLDSSTVQGVSEALNAVPGVTTVQNYLGGGTTMTIRGVSTSYPTFTGSSAVAYYLDSVPFGLVRSAVAPDSDAYDLQRVEVLRGPQGTLYGASALNGVVRVLTNDADLSNFDLRARVSDSGTESGGNNYRGDVAINVPVVEDKLAVRGVLGYQNDSGWVDQPDMHGVNWSELRTYRAKVNARPTEDLSIGLSAWSERDGSSAPSFGYTYNQTSSLLDQPITNNYDTYGAKIEYRFPWFSISSATSYLKYINTGSLGLDIPAFQLPGSTFFQNLESKIFSEEVNLNSALAGSWRWSAGGIFRRGEENVLRGYTGLIASVPGYLNDSTSKSYAAYGELTRLFFDGKVELTAGLRHFHDDESENDEVGSGPYLAAENTFEANTPRAVLTWHPNERRMAYVSYAQGFRSGFPQGAEVLQDNPGFPSLRPDRLSNYEVGSKGSLMDGVVGYDASVYYMYWAGIQQTLRVPFAGSPAGVPGIVNGPAASGIGTDLALYVVPVKDLTLRATVSWNNLEMNSDVVSGGIVLFRKGDRPNASPETTAGVSGEYLFALGSSGYTGRFALSGNYTSFLANRGLSGTTLYVQDGDPIVIARASVSIDSPSRWSARLFVDNLANYRRIVSETFIGAPDWEARVRPLTAGLEFEYRFR